jgi:RluA family pseudouridine synthase
MQLEILFEDYYIAVINKPVGLMVEADDFGNPSVEEEFYHHLRAKFPNHKEHYIGFPHRLDRVTQGLLLIAKTKAALTHLNKQLEEHKISKIYCVLVEQAPPHKNGKLKHFLKKDNKHRKAIISKKQQADFKPCELAYELMGKTAKGFTLLKIELLTGRFHQIRAQLAYEKMPVVGDALYGSSMPYNPNSVALIAHQLIFKHPKTNEEMIFEAPLPSNNFWKLA